MSTMSTGAAIAVRGAVACTVARVATLLPRENEREREHYINNNRETSQRESAPKLVKRL